VWSTAVVAQAYRAGVGSFLEHVAILTITGRFQSDFAEMVGGRAEWAAECSWSGPDDPRVAEPDSGTLEESARPTSRANSIFVIESIPHGSG
jgi:hypothetical protein